MSFCCPTALKSLSRAAAKAASARLRRLGVLSANPDWARRAEICVRCHLHIVHRGISYCGRPFLSLPHRDPAIDGCGCPCNDKAKDPGEHCPIDIRHLPATTAGGHCTCRWCAQSQIANRNSQIPITASSPPPAPPRLAPW